MKRVELLIDMARKLSGNTRYDSDSGVPQDVFVQFLNNAQDSMMKEVVNLKTKFLKTSETVSVVSGQETYSLPSDCYMQHIDTIRWYSSDTTTDFTTLEKLTTKEQGTNQNGHAFGYIVDNDGIHLSPPVASGVLKIYYSKAADTLQKRGGKITVCTQGGGNLTALTVDTTEASYDATEINSQYYLCVVDKHGAIKARNIPYNSVSNGVFSLSPFALGSSNSVAVGDYIVVGKNSVNLPQWPTVCESYLIKHMVYDAKYSDGSAWSREAKEDMRDSFISLAGSFAALSDDVCNIPITNFDYL